MSYKFLSIRLNSLKLIQVYPLSFKLGQNSEFLKFAANTFSKTTLCNRTVYTSNHQYVDNLISNSIQSKLLQSSSRSSLAVIESVRYKSSKSKKGRGREEDSDSDEDDDDDDDDNFNDEWALEKGKNFKDAQLKVTSLRLDNIVKVVFNQSRNKVEQNFYKNKIKVNHDRPSKKSGNVGEGDIIDFIKSADEDSEEIARVKILKIGEWTTTSDKCPVVVRKYPKLTKEEAESKDDE